MNKSKLKNFTINNKHNNKQLNFLKTIFISNIKFKIWICLPVIFLILVLDNISKIIAINDLTYNETVYFIPHFINFCLIYNYGSAYGSNSNNLNLTITLAVLITFLTFILLIFSYEKSYIIGFTFIFAGSISNLINRIWNNGSVVDFLTWELFDSFSKNFIFNFADFTICFGITYIIFIIIVLEVFKFFKRGNKN